MVTLCHAACGKEWRVRNRRRKTRMKRREVELCSSSMRGPALKRLRRWTIIVTEKLLFRCLWMQVLLLFVSDSFISELLKVESVTRDCSTYLHQSAEAARKTKLIIQNKTYSGRIGQYWSRLSIPPRITHNQSFSNLLLRFHSFLHTICVEQTFILQNGIVDSFCTG